MSSTSSCGEVSDSVNSDTELNTESDSEVKSESDADLDVLYKLFELESDTELQPPTPKKPRHALTTLDGSVTVLVRVMSSILILQYCVCALRHSQMYTWSFSNFLWVHVIHVYISVSIFAMCVVGLRSVESLCCCPLRL